MTRELRDRSSDHKALIFRPDAPENVGLVMFVHGWQGGYLSTWGSCADLLYSGADSQDKRREFSQWDYLFLGYATRSIETYLEIANRIFSEWKEAKNGKGFYPRRYTEFVLVGHSLGTLGIRQALAAQTRQPPCFIPTLKGVLLFGSPINGSPWARFGFWQRVSAALSPGNPQLRMLHAWSELAFLYKPWPEANVVLGLDDQVVGETYGDLVRWAGDQETHTVLTCGHAEMVKPKRWSDAFFDSLYGVLK